MPNNLLQLMHHIYKNSIQEKIIMTRKLKTIALRAALLSFITNSILFLMATIKKYDFISLTNLLIYLAFFLVYLVVFIIESKYWHKD